LANTAQLIAPESLSKKGNSYTMNLGAPPQLILHNFSFIIDKNFSLINPSFSNIFERAINEEKE